MVAVKFNSSASAPRQEPRGYAETKKDRTPNKVATAPGESAQKSDWAASIPSRIYAVEAD
jgi:hypothetical protein